MFISEMTVEELEMADGDESCMVVLELLKSLASHQSYVDVPMDDIWCDHLDRAMERVKKAGDRPGL